MCGDSPRSLHQLGRRPLGWIVSLVCRTRKLGDVVLRLNGYSSSSSDLASYFSEVLFLTRDCENRKEQKERGSKRKKEVLRGEIDAVCMYSPVPGTSR
jgi:hypothetical protein